MSLSASDPQPPPASAGRFPIEPALLVIWLTAAIGWGVWCWHGYPAFGPLHLATGAALVLALAIFARHGWVRLFGPVLLYEGLRAARRPRFFLLRWLYAIGLLILLLWVHWVWGLNEYHAAAVQNAYRQQARLAEQFFYAFALVQFAAVVLLTPAYVAGGVAEEKERKTLEFLLATDLRGREIVFGKLLARLGNLALFVLTGLPVLSLMQFFGGIDPGMLLASFAATALTAISLAALGILLSVQRRRARDAIILTYMAAAGYAAIASVSNGVAPGKPCRGEVAATRRSMGDRFGPMVQRRQSVLCRRPGHLHDRHEQRPRGRRANRSVGRICDLPRAVHHRLRDLGGHPPPADRAGPGQFGSEEETAVSTLPLPAAAAQILTDAVERNLDRRPTQVRLVRPHPRRAGGRDQLHTLHPHRLLHFL
jgi:hypothetical protein